MQTSTDAPSMRAAAEITAAVVLSQPAELPLQASGPRPGPISDSAKTISAKEASAALPVVATALEAVSASPGTDEPPPKRPKLQFGKGLASRMSSAAQSDLNLLESAVSSADGAAFDTTSQLAHAEAQAESHAKPESQPQEGPQYPAGTPERAQAEQLKVDSESPAAVLATLEDLLAQNSPESLGKLSWAQLHKDLQSLNTHKTRLQV